MLGATWLLRRAHLRGVLQDERLTHGVLGRAAGVTRARATVAVSGKGTLFVGEQAVHLEEGHLALVPHGAEPLARCADATFFEIEWDPEGALGPAIGDRVTHRTLEREAHEAVARLTELLRDVGAGPPPRSLEAATRRVLELLAQEGARFDVTRAVDDLGRAASPDDQRLCTAIDDVLSALDDGPHVVSLEERLGCSRRTVLRRTQALCERYLVPGLAAGDWRSVRDSYRLLIGAVFATHREMTTRALASMLGYASSEALCHAFANAGLPSPAALRERALRELDA